jgi:preprotein translocase SecE subunit
MNATAVKITRPFAKLFAYFREAKEELEKVSWPSRSLTLKYSILVVAITVLMAAFFGGLDALLTLGLEKLIGLVS